MRCTTLAVVLMILSLVALGPAAEAGKGGGGGKPGGGGGGGGGGSADPAIVYVKAPDLMVMDVDGGNATVLVDGAASTRKWAVRSHWSPDGNWLVFNSEDLAGPGIYVVSRDGSALKRVASVSAPDSPAWGPVPDADGNHLIVYVAGGDLYLLRLDPTTLDPVDAAPVPLTDTTDAYSDWDPTWAPDGRTIATFRDLLNAGGGTYSLVLYTLDAALNPSPPIIKVLNTTATWKVVGQELDFANKSNKLVMQGRTDADGFDIYVLDLGSDLVNGTPGALTRITSNPDYAEQYPSWSPDDSQIAYHRNASLKKDDAIMIMDDDGGNATKISKSGSWPHPDWR